MRGKTKKKTSKNEQSTYPCPECDKQFASSPLWKAHLKLHSTEQPYKCELCTYTCKIKKYLSRHVKKVHTKPVGHECTVCGKCFHFDCNLQAHMRVHTGEKPYKCKICGKAFSSSYSLSGHKLIHTGEKPFQCAFCDYACRDNSTIRRHQDRHMGISKDYPCSICKRKFKKKSSLQVHVDEVHFELDARKNPCEICDKLFKTKASLRLHVNTVHNKANRMRCEICNAKVTRNNLQSHMRRHVDVKPYKCSYKSCGRRFKQKGDLKKHAVIHYPDHHYQCDICERRFTRKYRLNRHTLIHNSKKYVECHHCGVKFSTKMYLSRHIKKAHGPDSKQYICDVCQIVTYTRNSIIMHLKYGHGTERDTSCEICNKDYHKYLSLKEHYLKKHNIKYSLLPKKKEDQVVIKEEPYELEITTDTDRQIDFTYEVDIQKRECDVEPDPLLPTYPIDTDTIAYSRRVLSEDISRSLLERDDLDTDDFYLGKLVKEKQVKVLPKQIIDRRKEEKVKQCLHKLLSQVRVEKQWKALEEARRQYNRRIRMASSGSKTENKNIRYFKKPESSAVNNNENNKNDDSIQENDKTNDEIHKNQENDKNGDGNDDATDNNDKVDEETNMNQEENDTGDENDDDDDKNDVDYRDSDESDEVDRRKLKFNTHQCYICFKLFKTKSDLKRHCTEHFDICNEKMLKKCPFCGYVTNLTITRHIKLVHNVIFDIPYGKVKERKCETGSKYVFEIDKDCELEIIPSISNLNKIASMKIDEKNRKNKNVFLGTTKLVKKGKDWVVEKQAVNLNNEYLLPEFKKADYQKLKNIGDGYLNRIKSLSFLAKTKGRKMLFPCSGCEKICLTMSALKLHSRKHEKNPKAFKAKVWKNKILNGYSKNHQKIKKKSKKKVKTPKIKIRETNFDINKIRTVGLNKLKVNNNKNEENIVVPTENRFAKPNPVKNKHKCDKRLIEFYENNIKGGDIEFWQFLKIFNKMSRENVNDFKDLEDRTDFGMHKIYNNSQVDEINNVIENNNSNTQNGVEKDVKKIVKKDKFTRAIMISKKEYLKRNKMKEEMRKRLKESKSLNS